MFKDIDSEDIINKYHRSITMHRIGRDGIIINYDEKYNHKDNIHILVYGEVDCRCHIGKQILKGRKMDNICEELVYAYFNTITSVIKDSKAIIVVGVIPPTRKSDFITLHGNLVPQYPFIGTDEERVLYTQKINELLEINCAKYGFIYFDPYDYYKHEDGTLKHKYSDSTIHLLMTGPITYKITELLKSLNAINL